MNHPAYPAGPPAAAGRERRRRPLRAAIIVALVCGVVAAAVLLWWPRTTVVRVVDQPSGIGYADGSAHFAVLTHVRAPIAAIRLSEGGSSAVDHHAVVLGRDRSGGYGHRVRFDATGMDPADLTVEWTAEGVWLSYGSGHRVFVPANQFTGGR
ncbi:hypothetical protein [Micromonospora sagamiensis]|uniref:hypothetical protein n=1 Tax=Micromonospora sagamiensis TaxID=47875 RepID=UPI0016458BBB|nr:hypothetical protein [Micromonospora sagamiensis]